MWPTVEGKGAWQEDRMVSLALGPLPRTSTIFDPKELEGELMVEQIAPT